MTKPTRILIVEDVAADADLVQRAIRKILEKCDFQVVETRQDFLNALKSFQPHVILSDYNLPHFDGMQALKLTLEHAPLTPLIIWTGSIGEDVAVDCMKAGASNYVMKENIKRLGPAIIHALEERELLIARKQAEAALQDSEKHLRALIENGMDNISLLAEDGTLIWESPATIRMLNYAQDEFIGQNIFKLIHPDDQGWTSDLFARIIQEPGSRQHGTFRLRHFDGTWRWAEAIVTNMLNEPAVNAIVVNYRDITERKQAEIELQQRNDDLALINALNEVINRGEGLDAVVTLMAGELKRIFSTDGTTIYLLDPEKRSLRMQHYFLPSDMKEKIEKVIGRSIPPIEIPIQENGYFQRVLLSGRSAITSDPEVIQMWMKEFVETTFLPSIARGVIRKLIPQIYRILKIQSTILIPLISDGQPMGLLDVSSHNLFTEDDLKRIETIGGQLTSALRRRQMEETLQKERNLLRILMDNLPDRIYAIDREGRKTLSNTADWKACGGKTMEDVIGRTDFDTYPRELAELFWQQAKAVIDSGKPLINYEEPGLDAEGRRVSILTTKIPLRDAEGKVVGLVGVGRDITERKRAEEALQEREEQFRTIFEGVQDAILVESTDGKIIMVNQRACEMFGYSLDEFLTKRVRDLIPEGYPIVTAEALDSSLSTEQGETVNRRANGEIFPIEISGRYQVINDEQVLLVVIRDITRRKRAEEALRLENERFSRFIESNIIGIAIADANGGISLANDYYLNILGVTRQDFLAGKVDWMKFTPPEWLPADVKAIAELRARGVCKPYEKEYVRSDGTHVPVYLATAKLPGPGEQIAAFVLDLTERKRIEASLQVEQIKAQNYLDIAGVMMLALDRNGAVTLINQKGCEILGYSADEIIGKNWINTFLAQAEQEELQGVIQHLVSGDVQPVAYFENVVLTKDGEERLIAWHNNVLRDAQGTIISTLSSGEDITERKRAEIERQTLLEIMQGFADTKDLQDFLKLVHRSIDKVIYARNFFVVLHQPNSGLFEEIYSVDQHDPPAPPSDLKKSITSYVFHSGEPLLLNQARFDELAAQGEVGLVGTNSASWLGVPLKTPDSTIGVIAVQDYENDNRYSERDRDFLASIASQIALTIEHRTAGISLMESVAQFRTLFEASPDAIMLINLGKEDWPILDCNAAACQMNGYTHEELVGQPIDMLNAEPYSPEGRAEYLEQIRKAGVFYQEATHRCKDGTIILIDIATSIITLGGREVILGIDRDITERKQAEAEIRRRMDELEALYENGLAVSRLLKPDEIGNRVIDTFARNLSWHHVTIRLRKEVSDDLELVAFNLPGVTTNEKREAEQHYAARVNKMGQGLSGWVIQTGMPFRTGNVHAHPRYIGSHAGIQSGLYMPLKVGERVIGVISVESEIPDAFTAQDERLLATLASQTAIAFENARLYQEIEQELSERKRAEEALRTSETHYRELADSITDILFELDQNLCITHWNKASEAITEIPAGEAIGKSLDEIFGRMEEESKIRQILQDVLSNRQPQTFEIANTVNEQKRSFEINAYPSTRGISIVAKDVTARKRSGIIMQKRLELMEYSAHHTLPDLMQKTIDEVNDLTESTVGFFHFVEEDQNTLGMQIWSTNALQLSNVPASAGTHLALDQAGLWAEAARQRQPLIQNDYQSILQNKGMPPGHVPLMREIVIPIIRNEKIMAVMGIANKPHAYTQQDLEIAAQLADYAWDITERKQMQVALEIERNQLARRVEERTSDLSRANANLARALRVKDEFLANMSHELRTPLNAILGLSESLGEQIAGPLNEKQQKYIATIGESGHHLLSLINDILDLAKIEAGQITLDINKVDLHSVCQASLRMIKQLSQKKNQDVSLEIEKNLAVMWADERRLKQMIVNLLSNAVKFTPEYGKLGLEVHGDEEANKIAFTVWDTGIGIKEADLRLLFQPFVQLDSGLAREATGTGLGLALVAQMARLHGGSVSASSQPEAGSRFSIILPWEPALAMDTASRMRITGKFQAIKPDQKNKPTILLVEDTQEVIMMIRDYLELVGYRVVTAQDGMDALVQAKLMHPDLILMDVQMPRMDGLEATRKLRAEHEFRYTPIIALTALAMSNDRERCLAAGMNEYISKPVHLKALLKIVQNCLFDKEESRLR